MINAIAKLATVNIRFGRVFDQSDGANADNKTNKRDTHALIDTRRYQTNKSHFWSTYSTLQPHRDKIITNKSTMNNNNENNQNARTIFRIDGQLRYHWDNEIIAISNRRVKFPETAELVTKRIELVRPGAMRRQWNKNFRRVISLP